jgi:RNA polymerase sigma-70 factor (ECF subfamily)
VAVVRADLLRRLGRLPEAAVEYERAAAGAANARERQFLAGRAAACRASTPSEPRR